MKVFVTGADGLLGSNTVRVLLERGHTVFAFIQPGKKRNTLEKLPIQLLYGDILDKDQLLVLTQGMDAVIHCAASTCVWPSRSASQCAVNVTGTENIIEACLANSIQRLVYVGTANSFASGTLENPGTEVNAYTAAKYGLDYMDSKRKAHDKILEAVKTQNLPAVIVNPTFMLGAFDSGPSSGAMILGLVRKKVPCATRGGKNFICVQDAAVGVVNALTMGRIGEAYILGNENLKIKDVFAKIGQVLQIPVPKRTFPSVMVRLVGRFNSLAGKLFRFTPTLPYPNAVLSCEHHYYSARKAVEELQLPQTPIERGIEECYQWFVANGKIVKS